MKLNKKLTSATRSMSDNRLMATLMGVTTLLVAVGIVLSRLWWADIRFTNKVLDRKNQINKTLEQNVAALPQLQENFARLESEGPKPEKVFEALPIREEYAALAKELEAVASLSGAQLVVTARSETAALPEAGQPTKPLPVEIGMQAQLVGNYSELNEFIKRLEQTTRPIKVVKATFSDAGTKNVTLVVDLASWWQPRTVLGDEKEVIQE